MKTIDEEIKINDQLNPALWDNNELKEDVKERLLDIVDNFLDGLKEDKINIDVVDVRILGSNANYNYTDKSDIDLHIVADFSSTPCEQNVMPQLYNAYRSLFSKAYDIKINGYDVELYVEDINAPAKSNGVYSLYTGWISEPKRDEIPQIDWEQFELVFDGMEDRYFDVVGEHSGELTEDWLSDAKKIETIKQELNQAYDDLMGNDKTRLYRYREWANNSNSDYKEYIYNDLKKNKDNSLKLWYNTYRLRSGDYDLSYDDFLKKPFKLYRATNVGEKDNSSNPFFSYALTKKLAQRFLSSVFNLDNGRTGEIEEIEVTPSQTLGMFPSDEEEIIIPNTTYETDNQNILDRVNKLIDYANKNNVELPYDQDELISIFKKEGRDKDDLEQHIITYVDKRKGLEEHLGSNVNEKYANNIDKDILDTIKNPLDKLFKNTKCSKSAGTFLDKYFYETDKPLKLCLGAIRHKGDESKAKDITHVWVELDGKVKETNFPNGDYERVLVDSLDLDRNEDLYNQVEEFLNKSSLREDLDDYLDEYTPLHRLYNLMSSVSDAKKLRKMYDNLLPEVQEKIMSYIAKWRELTDIADKNELSLEFEHWAQDILDNPQNYSKGITNEINDSNIHLIVKDILSTPIEDLINLLGYTTHNNPERAGAMFILPNGEFIFSSDYGCKTHQDFIEKLIEDYSKLKYPDAQFYAHKMRIAENVMEALLRIQGLIRCNSGSTDIEGRFYCVLQSKYDATSPTNNQYNALLKYFDLGVSLGRSVGIYCGEAYNLYSLTDYIPEELVKLIRRYYSSGTLYEALDYGYHAGDLGKSEQRERQTGGRNTGHFGTGTYFVGNPDKIKGYNDNQYGKGEAPHHIVDFSSYNLYKPSTNDYGYKLHDALANINNGYKYFTKNAKDYDYFIDKGINANNSGDFRIEDIPEIVEHLNNLLGSYDHIDLPTNINFNTIEQEEDAEFDRIYDELKPKYDSTVDLFDAIEDELMKVDKFKALREIVKEVRECIEDELTPYIIRRYKDHSKLVSDLVIALEGRHSKDQVIQALDEVNKHLDDKTGDSLSTIFMKALGYEGVDTRHLQDDGNWAGLDNTTYGSVIYDLKPETIVEDIDNTTNNNYNSDGGDNMKKKNKIVENKKVEGIDLMRKLMKKYRKAMKVLGE